VKLLIGGICQLSLIINATLCVKNLQSIYVATVFQVMEEYQIRVMLVDTYLLQQTNKLELIWYKGSMQLMKLVMMEIITLVMDVKVIVQQLRQVMNVLDGEFRVC
jgi:hypothetical protein